MYVVLWLEDVDREWGKKDSISAAEPQHTQPAYPATIRAGQRLKKKSPQFFYTQTAATNSKIYSSCGTTGKYLSTSDTESSIRLEIK